MKKQDLLNRLKKDIENFYHLPETVEGFNQIETILQQYARESHNLAWEKVMEMISKD